MFSIANYQYPQIVFDKNEKKLVQPITKQTYILRPEELVRLKWIDGALTFLHWNKTRISTEQLILSEYKLNGLRADIVLYDSGFKPTILVECKAPTVVLDSTVSLQAGLYNHSIKAPYIVLTNGFDDIWFKQTETGWTLLSEIPFPVFLSNSSAFDIDYWIQRGFLGKHIDRQNSKAFLAHLFEWFLKGSPQHIVFHSFSGNMEQKIWSFFYRIVENERNEIHIGCMSDGNGKTGIRFIEYQSRQIKQMAHIDLDALLAGNQNCATLFGLAGRKQVHLPDKVFSAIRNGDNSTLFNDFFTLI